MKRYLSSCGKHFWDNSSICSDKKGGGRQSVNRIKFFLLISLLCLFMFNPVGVQLSSAQDGVFTDSGQNLGSSESDGVALGDLDGDGDLDAFIANGAWWGAGEPNKVWLNDGDGNFTDSGQSLGSSGSFVVALGDVDGDGDLDALIVNHPGTNKVWLNDGDGNFADSGQALGSSYFGGALGDVDGDGDLDAYLTGGSSPDKVWLNDGDGNFADSGQNLGLSSPYSWDIALGDLDGDNDLDAFVVNTSTNKVWLNDGSGTFTDSGQNLGSSDSTDVALGDVDGDGDLDAVIANDLLPDNVWLNDGSGTFTDSGQQLAFMFSSRSQDAALGDLDGDGDLDAFIVKNDLDIFLVKDGANKVFLNAEAPAVTYDATGTWTYSTSNNYLDPGQDPLCIAQPNETATSTVTQNGNRVTIVAFGEMYNGYVTGANYIASSCFADIGGKASVILTFTLSSSTSGSGSVYWLWQGPDIPPQCSGGSDLSLTKGAGGAGGGGGGGGGCLIGTVGCGTRR
jgi:hypothetical protein